MRTLLLPLLVALLAGCAADDAGDATPTPEPGAPTPPVATPATAAVSLFDRTPGVGVPPTTMGIDPARLELALGVPVELTVTNDGDMGHDLVIEGLDVATETLPPGESATVTFTPAEAGTYVMYCSLGGDSPLGHRAQGMVGEVVVG